MVRYVIWLYVFFSTETECHYERVGIFSEADSLHVVSDKLNYHFKFKEKVDDFYIFENGHPDSLYSIQLERNSQGMVMFIGNMAKKESVVISGKCAY